MVLTGQPVPKHAAFLTKHAAIPRVRENEFAGQCRCPSLRPQLDDRPVDPPCTTNHGQKVQPGCVSQGYYHRRFGRCQLSDLLQQSDLQNRAPAPPFRSHRPGNVHRSFGHLPTSGAIFARRVLPGGRAHSKAVRRLCAVPLLTAARQTRRDQCASRHLRERKNTRCVEVSPCPMTKLCRRFADVAVRRTLPKRPDVRVGSGREAVSFRPREKTRNCKLLSERLTRKARASSAKSP